jgi:hypothetical protein
MKTPKLFSLAASLMLVSACATSPVPRGEATPVPSERILFTVLPKSADPAHVVFVRDTGFVGAGVNYHLSINGQRAASFATGERWEVKLDPGTYLFGVIPTDLFGAHSEYILDQTLLPGQGYQYRLLSTGAGKGGFRIQRSQVEASDAR